MTKKKIIGGLIRIEDTFDSGKHKLDNSSDLIYANIDVTTNPNGIDTQKTFTLYRFFNITKYDNEFFKLPDSINDEYIKTIFLFGYRDGYVDKTFFLKKNKNKINLNFIKFKIGNVLYDLYKKKSSYKTEIILVYHNDPNNKALYIILNLTGSDDKYNNLKKYLSSLQNDFADDKLLSNKLKFSYLKNLIQFTDKYLPLPKIELDINDLSYFSKTQIEKAFEASDIKDKNELKQLIKSINSTPPPPSLIGGGKIKKKIKLMNAGSNSSKDEIIIKLNKIKKFYETLGNTNLNPEDGNFDRIKQLNIIKIALAKLSDAEEKIVKEHTIVGRIINVINKPNQYVIDPYTKTINKLTLLESLLFIPQDRDELRLNKLQERKFQITEKLLEYNNLIITFGYINLNKIQKETGINKESYEELIKEINDKNINTFNIKRLIDFFKNLKFFNKTKAVEIINFLNFRLLVGTTKELVDYYNIVAKFGRDVVNKIHTLTGINKTKYKELISDIGNEYKDKQTIKKLIKFFTNMISLDINEIAKIEAKKIINSLNYLNEPNALKIINLLDNILITNEPKSLVKNTKILVNYAYIVDKFGSNAVNIIHNSTGIDEAKYKELISDIGNEYKDKQEIQKLIEFFTNMISLDIDEKAKIEANKIINLLKYVKTLHNSTLNINQFNKTINKLTLQESLLFIPQEYVDKNSDSRIEKYKLNLQESLLFIPQEYVDKNSDSQIEKYKLTLQESLLFIPQK